MRGLSIFHFFLPQKKSKHRNCLKAFPAPIATKKSQRSHLRNPTTLLTRRTTTYGPFAVVATLSNYTKRPLTVELKRKIEKKGAHERGSRSRLELTEAVLGSQARSRQRRQIGEFKNWFLDFMKRSRPRNSFVQVLF